MEPGDIGPERDIPLPDPSTGLMLQSTSGTTGRPKSFLYTHDQVFARCRQLERNLGLGPGDRVLLEPGLSTAVGRRMLLNTLVLGATLVLPGSTPRTRMVALMREKRVSFALLTPAHLSLFLRNEPLATPWLPETVIGVTSSPLLPEVHDAAVAAITPRLHDVYGTNETGILALTRPGDPRDRPGTVGRVAAGVTLEVVDDAGRPVPAGTVGAIRCRAEGYPAAYLGDTDSTGRCFRDGWFHPGDLGMLDAGGFLHLRGRTDDVINNQGVKFYPIELEEVLRRHPEVQDVAVVGIEDAGFHEFATALVVARRRFPLQELWELQRPLPSPMRALWIFFVDDLRRSSSGKLARAPLRQMARALIAEKRKKTADPH